MSRQIAGWLVTIEEREELLRRFPPRYAETVADHVTLRFGTDADTLLPMANSAEIMGEASDGSQLHIIWSLQAEREARESNDVTRDHGWKPAERVAVHVRRASTRPPPGRVTQESRPSQNAPYTRQPDSLAVAGVLRPRTIRISANVPIVTPRSPFPRRATVLANDPNPLGPRHYAHLPRCSLPNQFENILDEAINQQWRTFQVRQCVLVMIVAPHCPALGSCRQSSLQIMEAMSAWMAEEDDYPPTNQTSGAPFCFLTAVICHGNG